MRAITRSRVLLLAGAAGVAVFLFALTTGPASAHAYYVSSVPAANSIISTAPSQVTVTFAQALNPKGLDIKVWDQNDDIVSTGPAVISSTNPDVASVPMKGSGSEIYRVDWHTTSAQDGDSTLGAFVFGISGTDKVTTSASTTPSSSGFNPLLAGLIGLIIGAGVMFFITRGRAQPTV
jgi:methionine-rich copper-binding protein CopC